MRYYECYYSAKIKNKWIKNLNTSCWAGIQKYHKSVQLRIEDWETKETKEYAKLLVSIINKITPCRIYRGKIYYTLIQNGYAYAIDAYYDRNLILLNFIRYLWHNYGEETLFFETLKNSKLVCPFERLSEANLVLSKVQVKESPYYTLGHSNIDTRQKSIISLETFLNYTGPCTGFFKQ